MQLSAMRFRWMLNCAAMALGFFGRQGVAQVAARPVAVISGEQDRGDLLENPSHTGMVGTKILVLDANEPFLKLFDLNGRVLQRFVRKGGGPGEIGAAQRFLFDSTSRRVYVWDTMRLRANVYLLGDTLRFDTSYRTPAVVADACFLGRRLFALAFWGGHLVHEL